MKTGQEKSEIRKLAEWIHDMSWEEMPGKVQEAAGLRVLDLVGAGLGAVKDPLMEAVIASYGSRYGRGPASVWGRSEKFPVEIAAKVNAMLAHTLELDDVHPASKTHGSASIIPAAWALAESLHSSGEEFLTAVVCGYEVTARIGMALGVTAHRKKGWHATATCGIFGCAAAGAKLLGLETEQIIWALGMAGTQSSGLWAFLGDGASCKALHPGHCAACGLDAAFLAEAGMTGPEHILDAEDGGLLAAMSDDYDLSKAGAGLGEVWEILNMDVKPYPCCRSVHCIIDGVLKIRDKMMEKGLSAEELKEMQVYTYQVGFQQCAVSEGCLNPKSPLDAKFSSPYGAAAALLFGKVTRQEYEPSVIEDPRVKALIRKISVEPDEELSGQYPAHWGCRILTEFADGTRFSEAIQDPSGSFQNPLSLKQLEDKAESLIGAAFPGREKEIADQLRNIAEWEQMPKLGR